MRHQRTTVAWWLAVSLLAASAHGAPPGPSVEKLLETDRTVLDQEIAYPVGKPKITAELITIPRGASTSRHLHAVPMFGYVLEGELVVDYGPAGERTYRKGDSLVEAIDWAHRGRNAGKGKVKILVVYAGADGVLNAEPVEGQ